MKQRCLTRVNFAAASVLLVAAQAAVSSRHSPMLDSGVGHQCAQALHLAHRVDDSMAGIFSSATFLGVFFAVVGAKVPTVMVEVEVEVGAT